MQAVTGQPIQKLFFRILQRLSWHPPADQEDSGYEFEYNDVIDRIQSIPVCVLPSEKSKVGVENRDYKTIKQTASYTTDILGQARTNKCMVG